MKRIHPAGLTAAFMVFLIAAVSAGASNVPDKTVMTLEDCLELALVRNPHHLAVRERKIAAGMQVREAASRFFPSLSAQGTHILDEKLFTLEFPSFIPGEPPQRVAVRFTKDYQFNLNFSLPLFTGGRLASGYRAASSHLQASRETVRESRHETLFNVKQAFYGYLLARDFETVAGEALDLAEKHLANVRALHQVGMASRFDLLRAEVQASNLKPQVIRARNSLQLAELALKTVVGLDLDSDVEFRGELAFSHLEKDADAAVAEALSRRPEIRRLEHQHRMASEMLKAARASHLPTLAVGGAYNIWADRFDFSKRTWQNFYSVNLVVNIPLFSGLSTHAEVGRSKAMIRELEHLQQGLSDMVRFEVRQALSNYSQARETLLSQEMNVEQAREAVRIAELNYAEGLATSLDVSTAQVALSQALTNRSQALYDCAVSLAQLEKAAGAGREDNRRE